MGVTDPLADSLTKIRNGSRARFEAVDVKPSRATERVLDVLKQEGFIRGFKPIGETAVQRRIRVYLKYTKKTPAISHLVRVSKPGRRTYRKATHLPRVLRGMGVAVVSTSRGVMSEREAYRQRIGGEVVCYIW